MMHDLDRCACHENEMQLSRRLDDAVRLLRRAKQRSAGTKSADWHLDFDAAFGDYLLPGESRLSPDGKGRIVRPPRC